jgi:hypothetical protein
VCANEHSRAQRKTFDPDGRCGSKPENLAVSISRRLCIQYRTSSFPKQIEGSLRQLGVAHRVLHIFASKTLPRDRRRERAKSRKGGVQKSLPISADSRSANSMVSAISLRVSKYDYLSACSAGATRGRMI